jgi:anti-sigma regulatory factor (Ser/Thr protein kinase)
MVRVSESEVTCVLNIRVTQAKLQWQKISFSSTLYLYPILDLLISRVPPSLHSEIRLGLQEALVNAALHGNALNPSKSITVEYSQTYQAYCWVITDQGKGFTKPLSSCHGTTLDCPDCLSQWFPPDESEHGRGLGILKQVFDQVHWNAQGTQIRLSKKVPPRPHNLMRYFWGDYPTLATLALMASPRTPPGSVTASQRRHN